ncbi:MAG: hypothetical protein K8R59_16780 [Thermoanaerobaculales bacterium]|nr:hypothetical protein [Thermoanaerobaculales bacterium]
MQIGRLKFDRQLFRLLWDLFMVWVAVVNLSLILFDLSYLWLRPVYFQYLPFITRFYDPVLGIEPHPLTLEFAKQVNDTKLLLELDPTSEKLGSDFSSLAALTERIVRENVFDRSGQRRSQIIITRVITKEVGSPSADLYQPGELQSITNAFWSGSPELLRHRFALFDTQIRPLLTENYYREYNRAGHLTNHFWIIDLPFLILFWVEFVTRWLLALRQGTHARWFFFPIFNWYDLLGLIPLQEFRVFRLLRAVSMYMRLRRSDLSSVGKDFASRTVEYISNIVTEEVSDRVAIRLLEDYAEEIRDGTHLRIIEATFGLRRSKIEKLLAEHIRLLLTNEEALESFRDLLRLNLSRAVETSESLHSIPLPKVILKPVVQGVGEVILDTTLETITTTLQSEEGQIALEHVASSVLNTVLTSPALTEATDLVEEISLHVIEHMKATVNVKKWSLPEEERRRRQQLGSLT